ncbi:hypothetical protein Tco_0985922 [Tanacetum coccineum]
MGMDPMIRLRRKSKLAWRTSAVLRKRPLEAFRPSYCLQTVANMDLFAFIQTLDPTKVKVVKRERKEDEPQLLEITVGCTIPLLPVTPNRSASELEASVDKLFDEDGSGNQMKQGDSTGGGGGVIIQPTIETMDVVIKDVAPVQPKRLRKRKTMAVHAGESSHPPKKLREDHGTPSGTSMGSKSRSSLQ